MTFETTIGPGGARACYIDGLPVPEAVFDTLRPARLFPVETGMTEAEALAALDEIRQAAARPDGHRGPYFHTAITGARPLRSDALAVHTSQIPAVMARNKKHGLTIRYDRAGRPVFTDPGQRKALMRVESEAMGVKIVKKNSFNGD